MLDWIKFLSLCIWNSNLLERFSDQRPSFLVVAAPVDPVGTWLEDTGGLSGNPVSPSGRPDRATLTDIEPQRCRARERKANKTVNRTKAFLMEVHATSRTAIGRFKEVAKNGPAANGAWSLSELEWKPAAAKSFTSFGCLHKGHGEHRTSSPEKHGKPAWMPHLSSSSKQNSLKQACEWSSALHMFQC